MVIVHMLSETSSRLGILTLLHIELLIHNLVLVPWHFTNIFSHLQLQGVFLPFLALTVLMWFKKKLISTEFCQTINVLLTFSFQQKYRWTKESDIHVVKQKIFRGKTSCTKGRRNDQIKLHSRCILKSQCPFYFFLFSIIESDIWKGAYQIILKGISINDWWVLRSCFCPLIDIVKKSLRDTR